MAHIHTGPHEHDATASMFIVRTDGEEPALLLHRHKRLGTYMQFGGHVELTETPWQALLHEMTEESGYEISQLKLLQPPVRLRYLTGAQLHPYPAAYSTHAFNSDHNHTDAAYAFVTSEPPRHSPGEDESSELRLFTARQVRAEADMVENVREIGLFVLETLLHEWEQVSPPQP